MRGRLGPYGLEAPIATEASPGSRLSAAGARFLVRWRGGLAVFVGREQTTAIVARIRDSLGKPAEGEA